jgi:hypothetical protein
MFVAGSVHCDPLLDCNDVAQDDRCTGEWHVGVLLEGEEGWRTVVHRANTVHRITKVQFLRCELQDSMAGREAAAEVAVVGDGVRGVSGSC